MRLLIESCLVVHNASFSFAWLDYQHLLRTTFHYPNPELCTTESITAFIDTQKCFHRERNITTQFRNSSTSATWANNMFGEAGTAYLAKEFAISWHCRFCWLFVRQYTNIKYRMYTKSIFRKLEYPSWTSTARAAPSSLKMEIPCDSMLKNTKRNPALLLKFNGFLVD